MAGMRVNRQLQARGGAKIGSGSANYTDFDTSSGCQTMAGTAKIYKELWIPASEFDVVAAGSANMTSGSTYLAVAGAHFHTRTLTQTQASAAAITEWCGIAPLDACTTGSVIPYLEVMPTTAIAAGSDLAKPTVRYSYVNVGSGSTSSGSVALATATCINPGTLAFRQTLTMPNIPSFTGGQLMKFQVDFPAVSASNTCASQLGLVGLRLRYIVDKLGAPNG